MTLSLRSAWAKVLKHQRKVAADEKKAAILAAAPDPSTQPQHVSAIRLVDAAVNNDSDTVLLLLSKGQDIDALHPSLGYSALHAAVDNDHFEMVQLLVENGADVNVRRNKRRRGVVQTGKKKKQDSSRHSGGVSSKPETSKDTPLHFAALGGRVRIAEYLLQKCRALRAPRNSAQRTPLDYARMMQKWDTEILFYDPPTPPGNLTADSSQWLVDKSVTFTFYRSIADPQDRVPVLEYEFLWKMREPCDDERLEPVIREAKEWQSILVPAHDVYQMNYDVRLEWHSMGLLPAHTYLLRVRGRNLIGWSQWTSTMIYTTPVAKPERPNPPPFSITTTPSTIALRWYEPIDNGAPVLQYELHMKKGPTARACHSQEWKKYKLVLECDLKLFKLTPGDCHVFRVRARNKAGWSKWSPESEEIWTYKAINILAKGPRFVSMSWGKGRETKLLFRFQIEVLRLRDVPNLFYTLKDEIDPITIPQKYWRNLVDDVDCERYIGRGHVPPPGTPSSGFVVGDPDRPLLEPNTDYMFRCRSYHPDFGWAEWSDGIASEIVDLPPTYPDQMAPPRLLQADFNRLTIGWEEPLENGRYIDAYQVEMRIVPAVDQPDRSNFDLISPDMAHAPKNYKLPERLEPPDDSMPRLLWQIVDDAVEHRERSFEVLGLDFFTDYEFRISAKNREGWSYVGVASPAFRTAAVAPPGVPYQSPTDDSEPLPVYRFHHTASHTFTKLAVSWHPSRVLTAPYRIIRYNLQSLVVDSSFGDKDPTKEEASWTDHGTIDVPQDYPQDAALTWFTTQFETTRRYRFRVRALCDQQTAGNNGWSHFGQPSEPLAVKRKL